MGVFTSDIFEYSDISEDVLDEDIPNSLLLENATYEAAVIRLILGNIKITHNNKDITLTQSINFTKLPLEEIDVLTTDCFKIALELEDILNAAMKANVDGYFNRNRVNNILYKKLLNELTLYFFNENKSSVAAFVHLYRALELISYSFPLIYASNSVDYTGTYTKLQKFFGKDAVGELGFMRVFIDTIYDSDPILEYNFEISIDASIFDYVKSDLEKIFKSDIPYNFENGNFNIQFKHFIIAFITIRNRYFHFFTGKNQYNISAENYDIDDFFESLNPIVFNWLSIIICKISQSGLLR